MKPKLDPAVVNSIMSVKNAEDLSEHEQEAILCHMAEEVKYAASVRPVTIDDFILFCSAKCMGDIESEEGGVDMEEVEQMCDTLLKAHDLMLRIADRFDIEDSDSVWVNMETTVRDYGHDADVVQLASIHTTMQRFYEDHKEQASKGAKDLATVTTQMICAGVVSGDQSGAPAPVSFDDARSFVVRH